MTDAPVLIVGGNGKTGRRVDTRLRALGIATRPVSRSTTPPFDWTRPTTWAAALEGVRAAYVSFQPDLAVPGGAEAIEAFSALAQKKGVEHLVLLSGRGEDGAQRAEEALKASGIDWTIVRASWFNQNFSENFLLEGVLTGEIALPAGDVKEPFVDADDIADVAVAVLTETGNRRRVYEVTGPRALTFAEAVSEIAVATGRPIRYTQVPVDAFVGGLRQAALPEDLVALLEDLFTTVLDGRNTKVAHGVEDALARPPRDFRDYVRRTVAQGIWSQRT
ncbi:MAG: NAD(P)H-binding protein [Alphaproteobacteria bacterium]|nr:NAD(P)H-binding protein [Alphaproteobacteria bacterium]